MAKAAPQDSELATAPADLGCPSVVSNHPMDARTPSREGPLAAPARDHVASIGSLSTPRHEVLGHANQSALGATLGPFATAT